MFSTKTVIEPPFPLAGAEIRPGDIEGAMRFMDQAYDARFMSWVQNPENILLVTYHMRRISKEYDTRRVAHGIRWVTQKWPVEKVGELLLGTTMYQSMDFQGRLVNAVTADWPLVPNTVPIFGRFLQNRNPLEVAAFVQSATEDWDEEAVCELMAQLCVLLNWNETCLREIVVHFVLLCRNTQDLSQALRARKMCLLLHKRFATSFALSNSAHSRRNPQPVPEQQTVDQPTPATSQTAIKEDVRRRYQHTSENVNLAGFDSIQSMDLDE